MIGELLRDRIARDRLAWLSHTARAAAAGLADLLLPRVCVACDRSLRGSGGAGGFGGAGAGGGGRWRARVRGARAGAGGGGGAPGWHGPGGGGARRGRRPPPRRRPDPRAARHGRGFIRKARRIIRILSK